MCPHARWAAGNPYGLNLVHQQAGPKLPWDLESHFEETGNGTMLGTTVWFNFSTAIPKVPANFSQDGNHTDQERDPER